MTSILNIQFRECRWSVIESLTLCGVFEMVLVERRGPQIAYTFPNRKM